jgi:GntR family transcriptional repressor for pyruvate dehydrogenase complex
VVTLPGNESMANANTLFVRGCRLSLRTLQETREALEPVLARMAAQRRADEHFQELKSLHRELMASTNNFQRFAALNVKWHNAVTAMTS